MRSTLRTPQPALQRARQRAPEAREVRVADDADGGHAVIVPARARGVHRLVVDRDVPSDGHAFGPSA